jgi:WD40 repeat protein
VPLAAGKKLGTYEIVAPLGAGGMGEVYRAKDTRLGREVAIKVLPAAFAQDPERLARFEREARLLAALDHPNIARIFGLEELDGARGLVLELAEGEDLSARIARGALPPDEAIAIALQVARALEHAHERGIVHRDLKPANIKLGRDGAVKVLDFGLARAFEGEAAAPDPRVSQSPTITQNMTSAGVILGTAAYMSPEQARGRPVDRRADIWSFGVVLYEMLTGKRPFTGETVSETIASVIKDEPDFGALPAGLPASVRPLVERCMTREPSERLRDIGEARIVLAAPGHAQGPAAGHAPARGRWLAPAAAAALAVAATAVAFLGFAPAHPAGPVRRFRVPVEGLKTTFFTPLALTRDGRTLAYEAGDRIWVRRMDRPEPTEVPGSNKGRAPFWSWDQSTLCFCTNKKLWAFTPGAEQSRELCDIPESGEIVGGAWGAGGRIALAVWRGGLYEIPAGGGETRMTIPLDSATVDFHGPFFLPDGRTLMLYIHDKGEQSAVAVVEGSPPRLRRVFMDPRAGSASYSPTGHLLVTRESNTLGGETWAVPFSAGSRATTGPAFRVLDHAGFASGGSDGLLVAAEDEAPPQGQLVWRRRDQSEVEPVGEPQQGLSSPSLSPDGGRVAYVAIQDGNPELWVQDLVRGTRTRLAPSPSMEGDPTWSSDGSRIYFFRGGTVGASRIMVVASDGSGSPDSVVRGQQPALSPDGRNLVYTVDRRGNSDLWTAPMNDRSAAKPFLATASDESDPSFSPDGRWIAYASDESGRTEVYIRRYPEGDLRSQVSVSGGSWPRWTRRGDGIFFVKGDTLDLVAVGTGPRPSLGLPRALFSTTSEKFNLRRTRFSGFPVDASHDGARFIGVRQSGAAATRSLLFVENWLEEFRKR